MFRKLAITAVALASVTGAYYEAEAPTRCRGWRPIEDGAQCEVRECRANYRKKWVNSDACLRPPTCEELQADESATIRRRSSLCTEDADSGCVKIGRDFPFTLTTNKVRNTGDEKCRGNTYWFSFCVTKEATESEPVVIQQSRRINMKRFPTDNLNAVATFRAGCSGKTGNDAELRPYEMKCGKTNAARILEQRTLEAGGKLTWETITTEGGVRRSYIVFRSRKSIESNTSSPVVVELHGYGQCAEIAAAGKGRWLHVAAKEDLVLVFPQGLEFNGINTRGNFQNDLASWAIRDSGFLSAVQGTDDYGFLKDLVVHLKADHTIDGRRVYMSGHSNGAAMAQSFALINPELVAAVGSFSLMLLEYPLLSLAKFATDGAAAIGPFLAANPQFKLAPTSPVAIQLKTSVPVVTAHGLNDNLVPFDKVNCEGAVAGCIAWPGARENNFLWAAFNNCQLTPKRTSVVQGVVSEEQYSGCDNDFEVTLLAVNNTKHFPFIGEESAIDENGDDALVEVDTVQMVWDRIKKYSR